ncbi:MAG: PKD domain-containing protein, partial [Planctomycetes bacterium]|nr:PKD domain-containing protein [Planctomycetota bacterium]
IDDLADIAGGTSMDAKDWACIEDPADECAPDDIPDECQEGANAMSEETYSDELPSRCEYHDSNCNDTLDIAEPWEDFLRRWDSCIEDPDASLPSGKHWIKIYDPRSEGVAECTEGVPPEMMTSFNYNDPGYIYNNYPGDTDTLVARAGNGLYDPSDSWTEIASTKMQWKSQHAFATTTPLPGFHSEGGQFFIGDDVAWYDDAWQDRYVELPRDFYHGSDFASPTPAWPSGENPNPEPPGNQPGLPNTPEMIPFPDPTAEPDDDWEGNRRHFQANRGGLHGDGTGWLGNAEPENGPDSRFVVFETDLPNNFEEDCSGDDCKILPEEADGDGEPRIYYDGLVEHDDLPSSKYHFPGFAFPFGHGDKKLGEATGNGSHDIWGEDTGDNNPDTPSLSGDSFTIAAGPYAINGHGARGRDGGNVLLLEWLTWRTDGTSPSFGTAWEWVHGPHDYAGPGSDPEFGGVANMHFGFRDYNLDGMIDQGEVRPPMSDNYIEDSFQGSPNDGTGSLYPFNRQRLLEDCVAALDGETDWDDWIDVNTLNRVAGGEFCFDIDFENWTDQNGDGFPDPNGCNEGTGDLFVRGFVSGIVFLPPGSFDDSGSGEGGSTFPFSPLFYPIHNEDADDPEGGYPFKGHLNFNLFFHDLVTQIGYSDGVMEEDGLIVPDPNDASRTAEGNQFVVPFAAHEWGHAWEGFPDLYDYDVLDDDGGSLINFPIGLWCLMTNHGQLVHPIAPLKENSGWIDPIDLATVLTPGVPQEITIPASEDFRDETYFFYENLDPVHFGERFYFYHVGDSLFTGPNPPGESFDDIATFGDDPFGIQVQGMPGPGLLIEYVDLGVNPEGLPTQQMSATAATYMIIAADGRNDGPSGVNPGNAEDAWPGDPDLFADSSLEPNFGPWNRDSFPTNRWKLVRVSGIEIASIESVNGGSRVTFVWKPADVPSLEFIDPPGGSSFGSGVYPIRYEANDLFGGTTMEFYYTLNDGDYTTGTLIGIKEKPLGLIADDIDWDLADIDDNVYYVYAKLIPGEGVGDCDGEPCVEAAFSAVRAGRNNFGDGTLTIQGVDSEFVKLESWVVEMVLDEENNPVWTATGSLSDLQTTNPTAGTEYTTDGNEVTFLLQEGTGEGALPFAVGDRFVFVTTGLTAHAPGIAVMDGKIDEGPTAVIRVLEFIGDDEEIIPAGPAPLALVFDAQDSTDPSGGNLTYNWNFGDGTPDESGEVVPHTFTLNGSYTVTLTATNGDGAIGEDQVDVEVINQTPSAAVIATPTSGPNSTLDVHFDARLSSDPEDGLEGLIFEWNFGDCPESGCTAGDGEVGTFQETDHFYSTSNPPEVFFAMLTVTDSGGATDTITLSIMVGNTNPTAAISASNTIVEIGEIVLLNGSSSFDPDGDELTFSWNFGDGSPEESGENVEHVYTDENIAGYPVTLTVSDGLGGVDTAQVLIIVLPEGALPAPAPNASFVVTPATTVELGTEMTFTSTSSPAEEIVSLDWDFGDSAGANGLSVSHTYAEAGVFVVTLIVVDVNANDDIATQTITVVDPEDIEDPDEEIEEGNEFDPVASFTAVPTTGPAPLTAAFDASASSDEDGDSLTYSWDYDDGETDAGVNVTHTFTTAGAFNVVLTVDDGRGRSDEVNMLINVLSSPSSGAVPVARIATGPRSGPVPLTIAFDANLSTGDNLTYEWLIVRSADGSTEALINGAVVSHTFTVAGTYEVTLTVTDDLGRSDSSATETVTANQATVPGSGEPGVGSEVPDGNGSDGFNIGRPTSLCGAGMLMGLFASAVGLVGTLLSQRRRRL